MTIFISDTSSLRWRVLMQAIIQYVPSIWTFWVGPTIAGDLSVGNLWRWGYGMWAIVIPVASIPFITTLFLWEYKNKKAGIKAGYRPRILQDINQDDSILVKLYKMVWVELDLLGCLLLIAGLTLILVPISLTGSGNSMAWRNAHFIAMLVVGFVLFILFLVWDALVAKKPFVPFRLVKHKTVVAACVLSILDFMHYSLFSVFFPSYLQVAGHYSPGRATRIE